MKFRSHLHNPTPLIQLSQLKTTIRYSTDQSNELTEMFQNRAISILVTHWSESSKVKPFALYPLLEPGGALIIDHQGHFVGGREPVD
jgi:hypothetical protein